MPGCLYILRSLPFSLLTSFLGSQAFDLGIISLTKMYLSVFSARTFKFFPEANAVMGCHLLFFKVDCSHCVFVILDCEFPFGSTWETPVRPLLRLCALWKNFVIQIFMFIFLGFPDHAANVNLNPKYKNGMGLWFWVFRGNIFIPYAQIPPWGRKLLPPFPS